LEGTSLVFDVGMTSVARVERCKRLAQTFGVRGGAGALDRVDVVRQRIEALSRREREEPANE
jgi:hypothetical protein